MNDNFLMECGLCFIALMEEGKIQDFTLSDKTVYELNNHLESGKRIVSIDIFKNCMDIGLGYKRSYNIAKRFSNKTFKELADVSDNLLLKCDGIGQSTINKIRETLKPVKEENARVLISNVLLPTKVVSCLADRNIIYIDQMRLIPSYDDINTFYEQIANICYQSYVTNDCSLNNSYLIKVIDYMVSTYIRCLNNFVRHGYKTSDNTTFRYIRYFLVAYFNELLFKLDIPLTKTYLYFSGDVDEKVFYYNGVFNKMSGYREYNESDKLLKEVCEVTSTIKEFILENVQVSGFLQ